MKYCLYIGVVCTVDSISEILALESREVEIYFSIFYFGLFLHFLTKGVVRDIATFFEQPLQYGGCISDFQNHCCNLISKEVAAAMLKIANTASNLDLCCTSVLGR